MKKIVSSVLVCAALASSAVYAQGAPDNHGHDQGGGHGQGPQGHDQQHGPQHGGGPGGGGMHGGKRMPAGPAMRADRGPGPGPGGPGGDWHRRGGRLPGDYRDRQYVVDDWRGYNLQPPPRGYHWVGVGGDYMLVAITSGIIAQIITGR